MEVRYGPPGHKGVTQLMSVGSDDLEPRTKKVLRTASLLSIGVWALGLLSGSKAMKNVGFGAGLAAFGTRVALERARKVEVETAPTAPQDAGPAPQGRWVAY